MSNTNAIVLHDVTLDDERWQALLGRDRSCDGKFYYGVITTGVYCRPSCAARQPKPENVRFYQTQAEAQTAGLRPCKRCKPDEETGENPLVRELCRYLEIHSDESVTLEHLASRTGLSPHHLQRTFKAVVGVSPKQYLDRLRLDRFKGSLREPDSEITRSIFDAGYGSISRLYEKLDTRVGMTPMEYRRGGEGITISYATSMTPLGLLMIGATDRGLCFVQFGEDKASLQQELRAQYPKAVVTAMQEPAPAPFADWMAQLNAYLEGRLPNLSLPVHVRATAFQLMVWTQLQKIPAGQVASYREVAEAIGQPTAARAVARACASNSVALAIPCHRVIRGTGEMGGYRWGINRKRTVLDLERRIAANES